MDIRFRCYSLLLFRHGGDHTNEWSHFNDHRNEFRIWKSYNFYVNAQLCKIVFWFNIVHNFRSNGYCLQWKGVEWCNLFNLESNIDA